MTAYADAYRHPFANGTEANEWEAKWCDLCAHDHAIHNDEPLTPTGAPGCSLIAVATIGEGWPEAWIPEPDDGRFFLPSRMCCTAFTPCEPCGGDPGAEARAERIAEVTAYWKARR